MLHLSDRSLGLVLLGSALGAVTTMPFAGGLIHRHGSRRISLLFGALLCLVMPLVFVAPSAEVLFAVLYLVGVSNGQMDVAMNSHSMLVQDRFPRPILSAVHGWFSVGGFVGGIGAALANRFHVPPIAHLVGASCFLIGTLALSRSHLFGADADKSDDESPMFAMPHGRLWLLGAFVMFAFVSEGAVWDWSTVFLRDVRHAAPWLCSFGFGVANFGMALTRFLGDAWTHRLGRTNLLRLGAALAAGGLLIAVTLPSAPLSILGFVIAGVGLANLVPLIFRSAAQVPGVSAGFGLAAVTTCGYSGFLGGPPLVGWVASATNLPIALGSIALLCITIAVFANRAIPRTES